MTEPDEKDFDDDLPEPGEGSSHRRRFRKRRKRKWYKRRKVQAGMVLGVIAAVLLSYGLVALNSVSTNQSSGNKPDMKDRRFNLREYMGKP